MNLLVLSWKNTWEKPLSSGLSILLTGLSIGVFLWISFGAKAIEESIKKDLKGIDLVVGAKGSPLQLILSSVYHIDNPTGNINLIEAEKIAHHPMVKTAIPLALGDNYKNYRIVGSDSQLINHYEGEIQSGGLFHHNYEVVIGSSVAQTTGLKVGDKFYGNHGVQGDFEAHEHAAMVVTGILKPSNSVLDKLVITPLPTVWEAHEHTDEHTSNEHHTHDHISHDKSPAYVFDYPSDSTKEITSLLLSYSTPMATFQLPRYINSQTNMQAAMPAIEVNRLIGLLDGLVSLLKTLAIVILLVSGLSIFIGLYNQLQQRKVALALLRVQGAKKITLWFTLTLEGIYLAVLGFVLGYLISRGGLLLMNSVFENDFQQEIVFQWFTYVDLILFLGSLGLGIISALPSSVKAFTLNLSKTLHHA